MKRARRQCARAGSCCLRELTALSSLSEVVTRLSPLCCESMAQSGAVSKVFVLIRSCNRSVPCMDVISYAVQVLLNVAKVGFCSGRGAFTGLEVWLSKPGFCLLIPRTQVPS